MLYRIRYALRLWRKTDMTLLEAFRYGCDPSVGDGDPIEDADEEIYNWRYGYADSDLT